MSNYGATDERIPASPGEDSSSSRAAVTAPAQPAICNRNTVVGYTRVDRVRAGSRLAAAARLGRLQKAAPPWSDQCRTALAFRRAGTGGGAGDT